ncbi:MAG: hypothetical protein M5U09_19710 [Gammaproteobacteria bacterium]|nr:hypothetical protein [Gammaproteobacteria bacterium]
MMAQRRLDAAADAWRRLTGEPIGPGTISNPGFEFANIAGGFGWRFADTPGANTITDDTTAHGGRKSLAVVFDGSENLNYYHARQPVVVEPNARYRLEGAWQGRDITTRSGIFIDIRTRMPKKTPMREASPATAPRNWQPFTVEFQTPPDAALCGTAHPPRPDQRPRQQDRRAGMVRRLRPSEARAMIAAPNAPGAAIP